jgi:hypothetical protein
VRQRPLSSAKPRSLRAMGAPRVRHVPRQPRRSLHPGASVASGARLPARGRGHRRAGARLRCHILPNRVGPRLGARRRRRPPPGPSHRPGDRRHISATRTSWHRPFPTAGLAIWMRRWPNTAACATSAPSRLSYANLGVADWTWLPRCWAWPGCRCRYSNRHSVTRAAPAHWMARS